MKHEAKQKPTVKFLSWSSKLLTFEKLTIHFLTCTYYNLLLTLTELLKVFSKSYLLDILFLALVCYNLLKIKYYNCLNT